MPRNVKVKDVYKRQVFTVVIVISRDAEISLNLSAEMQSLQLSVEERIQEHDLSPESHKDFRIAARCV